MLYQAGKLQSYSIQATDGTIGDISDFYFDDRFWTLRYFVVDTGKWLPGKRVLLSPSAVTRVDPVERLIHTNLTKEQIKDCPSVNSKQTVSREHEQEAANFFGWHYYWSGPFVWGSQPTPKPLMEDVRENMLDPQHEEHNSNLRSTDELTGLLSFYSVGAADGDIGQVEDFLFDSETWTMRYILINTTRILPGKHVLLSPLWINEISWSDRRLYVDMTTHKIKHAPGYNPREGVTPEFEEQLHQYFDKQRYWEI